MNALEKLFKEKGFLADFGKRKRRLIEEEDVRTALLEFADELDKRGKSINLHEDWEDLWKRGEHISYEKIAKEIRKAVGKNG